MPTPPVKKARSSRPILRSRFSFNGTFFFWSNAVLRDDRLDLTGVKLTGLYSKTIRLADVNQVVWWSQPENDTNLTLTLADGETVGLWIQAPGLWKFKLDELTKKERVAELTTAA